MAIEKLHGTREDMNILKMLIGNYFKSRIKEGYIPEGFKCKITFIFRPIKQFTIEVTDGIMTNDATIPFMPVIVDFAETTEKIIEELVESIEGNLKNN